MGCVKLFLERGADLNKPIPSGDFPIHIATFNGYPDLLDFLIKKGDNVNKRGCNGKTPLHYAAELGYVDLISLLAFHGADPRLKSKDGLKPMDLCISSPLLKIKQNKDEVALALTKAEYDIMQKERRALEKERLFNFGVSNNQFEIILLSLYKRK